MPLNRLEIDQLLKTEGLVYIATTKKNGDPHIAPIWFVYHNDRIYFETDQTTVKFRNIKSRNKIALCFSGKLAYLIEGSVKWWTEKDLPAGRQGAYPLSQTLLGEIRQAPHHNLIVAS